MKRLLTLLVLAVASVSVASAQSTVVTGVLRDSVSGETEPYATVRVYRGNNSDKPVAMSVTGDNGEIKQTINGKGSFTISFESVGKKKVTRNVNLTGQSSLNLGFVNTTDDSQLLSGVEVVAQKPIVKMETDKLTYDVQEDVESKSASVLDMLRKVPMVTVDGQDNISVNGGSSFKIYVNGRPNPMFDSNASDILKSMPASTVKSIEVITNPGAKYDAEGTTNIINITMNNGPAGGAKGSENLNGYNGSISATASTNGVRGSASVSGQQDKITYSAMASGMYSKRNNTETTYDRTESDGGTAHYYQKGDNKVPVGFGNFSLGYQLDQMSAIHASFNFMKFHMDNDSHATTSFLGGNYGDGFSYGNLLNAKTDRTSINANADWSRFLNKERTSSIALTYQFSSNPQRNRNYSLYDEDYSNIPDFTISDRYTDNHTHSTEHTVQLDYVAALAKDHTLSLGAKYINHLNRSDSRYYDVNGDDEIFNTDNSTIYNDRQQIGAAYAEYNGTFGKFNMREGLRYEYTWEKISYELGNGEGYSKDYGTLVPSASFSYKPTANTNIGLTYAMNISRPGISYLNPYVDRSNPAALTYGNPDLDVVKTHSINLVMNYFSPKFLINFTAGGQFCNNSIGQYTFIDDNQLLNTTYINDIHDRRLNFNTFMRITPTKTTVISLNGGLNYVDMRSDLLAQHNSGWQYNAYLNVEQTMPWQLQWGVMAMIQGNRYNLQGYGSGPKMFSTSLTRKFFDDKFTVGIRYFVPFTGKLKIKQYTDTPSYTQTMNIKIPVQTVSLTLTYNFGNTKKKFQQHQSRVKSEYGEEENNVQNIDAVSSGDMQQRRNN